MSDPICSMCQRPYDPEFMTGLPCRVFSREDVVTPGCPAQQRMMAELNKQVRRTSPAGGCLMLILALPLLLIPLLL
ncbi:hypothetical protein ABZ297_27000 [Nonomuraea sp. NPDC005983]|uniref:hypothetical protein n=1 Tax=Nonomuraea sp. NPDC005983 TaxID=3155595 RepID=UPI0033BD1DC9